jgi:PAS domain S-box-containing protein
MTDTPGKGSADELRKQAERNLKQRERPPETVQSDIQRLLHELQVHQIELEMQNEALRQSQAETQAALDRLTELNSRLEEEVLSRSTALMRSEAHATNILNYSACGLYGIDPQGRITFINTAACDLLGVSADRVIGQSAHRLFHSKLPDGSPYPDELCPTHEALKLGQRVRVDTEVYWRADGEAIPVTYAVHPLSRNGDSDGAVISFVDMSEQRAAAAARERALSAAEDLARVRSEFVANMSHEIRTPLNGVLGFAEIGARNYQDSAKAKRAFEQIKASGQHLLGVINDILDFSKIEAGRLPLEAIPMTLAPLIRETVALVEGRIATQRLELSINVSPDMPQAFVGDPLRLRQVLLNLLTNAVKFTPAGRVTLSAFRDETHLFFRVADTGIGMDEEQLRQLFEPFQQADGSITRRFGGSGLGLAISKRLLDLMNGEIEVESTPGLGSAFTFRLPYIVAGTPAEAPAPHVQYPKADKPLAGLSILVAEDEQINQIVMQDNLTALGAHAVIVGNGEQAVMRVFRDGANAYDIVLMDIQMPGMDGYAATRQLQKLAPNLPVIGQTAHVLAEERAKCFEAGMADHIAKPFLPEDLVTVILRHVTTRSRS